jgi:PAS domain S-box-containing protein
MSAAAEFAWKPPDPKTEFRLLFQNAPVAMAQCQREGSIVALNPALELMLGVREKTPRSLCLADLLDPQCRADSERFLRELFDGDRESFQLDSKSTPLIRASKDRTLRWTAWRVAGISGEPDYALATVEDSAREPDSWQRARQAEKLEIVGRLAGGVAHDFNNLLTGVLLYCDLLMAGLEADHKVRKYAEEIRNASMQATGLVRQLLAVSRPANNAPRLLSLNDVVEGMRNLLARLIGENIELKFRLDPNLGLIKMDPAQAQQILLNLALNARDAMPAGGEIHVETRNCKVQILTEPRFGATAASLPCALFVVGDNGSGMESETRSHLFEAFFTTKPGKGTGLGLATVHDIVTSNGGLIHVDSGPARGTRITVLLPLIPEAAAISQNFSQQSELVRKPQTNEGAIQLQHKEKE